MARRPSPTARRFAALACLALAAGSSAAEAGQRSTSRYSRLAPCRRLGHGPQADWISYRCAGWGEILVWLTYTAPTKAHLGFGPKQNVSGVFDLGRDHARKLEWRGVDAEGRFEPFAVIVRVRAPAVASRRRLVVYHLRPDGTSCLIGEARTSPLARALADRARDRFTCEARPIVP